MLRLHIVFICYSVVLAYLSSNVIIAGTTLFYPHYFCVVGKLIYCIGNIFYCYFSGVYSALPLYLQGQIKP